MSDDDVHPNVRRVVAAARRAPASTIEPVRFPDGTKTAADAAAAIGVDVGQIVKSLIFAVDGDVVLAYVSGANQLDEPKLAAAAGGDACARVDADTVRAATGYPIGGVPPFGHATPLPVFVDPDLLAYDEVWAAAGTWHDVFAHRPGRPRAGQRRHRHRPQALTDLAAVERMERQPVRSLVGRGGELAVDSAKTAGSTAMNIAAATSDDRLAVGLEVDELALDQQLAAVAAGEPAAAGDRPVQRRRRARSGSSARR